MNGEKLPAVNPRILVEGGMAHVPEDRHKHGLVLQHTIADNMVLNTYYQEPFANGLKRNPEAIEENAHRLVKEFDVRTPSFLVAASTLSGGNQQKVIVAREFSRPIHLLIANQPTRGLDVGSIEYIHRQIVAKRDQGIAVLLISAELDEITSLSDRIAVMYHGQIVAVVDAASVTREELGLMMAGGQVEKKVPESAAG
jgi:simple sugar transport system ATP-binding protein